MNVREGGAGFKPVSSFDCAIGEGGVIHLRKASELMFAPIPKKVEPLPERFALREAAEEGISYGREEIVLSARHLQDRLQDETGRTFPLRQNALHESSGGIRLIPNADLADEGYTLEIGKGGVTIGYGSSAGAFYGANTLLQIVRQCPDSLPCLRIEDAPDFPVRGVMLDISRNKIPTMPTLYRLIDFLADLKINHLQLYIEGFSFAYPSFPQVWEGRTPVTGEEMERLDAYCKERFIDFVPNQNSFGHMAPWLSREEFRHLAECPDGFEAPWGYNETPMTLNPLSEESLRFIERTYDDLLPHFTSRYFNVGCDETFDLGKGKSKEACERYGKGRVYLDYLLNIHELVKARGKTMMFWGDIVKEHPELVPELPDDIIAMEWGYDADQPSEEQCSRYAQAGVPFYVCPGTSSWNSITGVTGNMKQNIRNAASLGLKYGARGLINTDWGDAGHWQPTPVSYPGLLYGAAMSWGAERNAEIDLGEALTRLVFKDSAGRMGRIAVELGNYYLRETRDNFNGTGVFRTLHYHQLDDSNRFLDSLKLPELGRQDFERVRQYVSGLAEELDLVEMKCDDAELVMSEYRQAVGLILHGTKLGMFKRSELSREAAKQALQELAAELEQNMRELQANWLRRNRIGGLTDSMTRLHMLLEQYRKGIAQCK